MYALLLRRLLKLFYWSLSFCYVNFIHLNEYTCMATTCSVCNRYKPIAELFFSCFRFFFWVPGHLVWLDFIVGDMEFCAVLSHFMSFLSTTLHYSFQQLINSNLCFIWSVLSTSKQKEVQKNYGFHKTSYTWRIIFVNYCLLVPLICFHVFLFNAFTYLFYS